MQSLIGTGVALVTPFKKDFSIDTEALKRIVNFSIDGGIEYLVVMGTTAENATLSSEEKELVIRTVIEANNGSLPLVLGVGGNNTMEVVEELKTREFQAQIASVNYAKFRKIIDDQEAKIGAEIATAARNKIAAAEEAMKACIK